MLQKNTIKPWHCCSVEIDVEYHNKFVHIWRIKNTSLCALQTNCYKLSESLHFLATLGKWGGGR